MNEYEKKIVYEDVRLILLKILEDYEKYATPLRLLFMANTEITEYISKNFSRNNRNP